ncbi:hypothetical protein BOX15_Mlig024753g1 [Macrostomum lignano]|uniref:BEN domain-containing protein n=1 Tax=Macrostomum lignano TaxID=282301 RepID=A0A267EXY2_9PLAT|nr:hypothetical protein BOX15_Mlig024753g1 [Macrostomum lignano]
MEDQQRRAIMNRLRVKRFRERKTVQLLFQRRQQWLQSGTTAMGAAIGNPQTNRGNKRRHPDDDIGSEGTPQPPSTGEATSQPPSTGEASTSETASEAGDASEATESSASQAPSDDAEYSDDGDGDDYDSDDAKLRNFCQLAAYPGATAAAAAGACANTDGASTPAGASTAAGASSTSATGAGKKPASGGPAAYRYWVFEYAPEDGGRLGVYADKCVVTDGSVDSSKLSVDDDVTIRPGKTANSKAYRVRICKGPYRTKAAAEAGASACQAVHRPGGINMPNGCATCQALRHEVLNLRTSAELAQQTADGYRESLQRQNEDLAKRLEDAEFERNEYKEKYESAANRTRELECQLEYAQIGANPSSSAEQSVGVLAKYATVLQDAVFSAIGVLQGAVSQDIVVDCVADTISSSSTTAGGGASAAASSAAPLLDDMDLRAQIRMSSVNQRKREPETRSLTARCPDVVVSATDYAKIKNAVSAYVKGGYRSTDADKLLRTLYLAIFTDDELTTCSYTGRRSTKTGPPPKAEVSKRKKFAIKAFIEGLQLPNQIPERKYAGVFKRTGFCIARKLQKSLKLAPSGNEVATIDIDADDEDANVGDNGDHNDDEAAASHPSANP